LNGRQGSSTHRLATVTNQQIRSGSRLVAVSDPVSRQKSLLAAKCQK
jgi:hypothetical protein